MNGCAYIASSAIYREADHLKNNTMFGTLNDEQVKELLSANIIGRIGCHSDGITYVVPISYVFVEGTVYCHSREGLKVEMMRKNPDVCFEVDELTSMANWRSIIAWGKYEELTAEQDRNEALKHLLQRVLPVVSSQTTHLSNSWPFAPTDLSEIEGIVFKIRLEKVTGRFEKYDGLK
jgi:nitroimidazol reductase NimA-like FMN-containing flavoprotein (pyridoxamine 5'-phosphate oxidase superfamily)